MNRLTTLFTAATAMCLAACAVDTTDIGETSQNAYETTPTEAEGCGEANVVDEVVEVDGPITDDGTDLKLYHHVLEDEEDLNWYLFDAVDSSSATLRPRARVSRRTGRLCSRAWYPRGVNSTTVAATTTSSATSWGAAPSVPTSR